MVPSPPRLHRLIQSVSWRMSIVPFGRRTGGLTGPFAVNLWDPFDGSPFNTALASTSSGLFNPFAFDLWDPFGSPFGTFLTRPSTGVVWKETPEAHFFRANLPGVPEEEVQVRVDGQTLQISGGQLMSRFSLPDDAKVDHLRAGMEDGVLIVTVPKVEVRKPNVRTVDISG